jgi:uncharacterized repeat protein (TIGR04076 family)
MSDKSKVKITVERILSTFDIFGDSFDRATLNRIQTKCQIFKKGQEFMVEKDLEKPKDFCSWAWTDIQRDVVVLSFGGHFPAIKEGLSVTYSCCTDGLRPVIFRLEKIEP